MRSRCMTSAIRYLFPEVLLRAAGGLYTDVEMMDASNNDVDVEISADGTVEMVYDKSEDVTGQ